MRATSIHLYRPGSGTAEERYVGCFSVPCPDDDPRRGDLAAVNCGRWMDTDGTAMRSFFFADEIGEMVELAEAQTRCIAEADEDFPYPLPDRPLTIAEEGALETSEHLERMSKRYPA